MKQPGTLVRHDQREYLLVEGGYNAETRAVILLARPDDPGFPPDPASQPLRWVHQGLWTPVARWTAAELRIPDERHAGRRDVAQKVIEEYVAGHRARPAVAWTARHGTGFVGSLEVALPMGLAVHCHDTEKAAASEEGAEGVVPVDNLGMFLTHLVREGYAGALWNGRQPIFFCADENADLQFLRVKPGPAGDRVEMEIVDEKDTWQPYDGAEEIEFIDNREACDARLVEMLGRKPLVGWPEAGRLYSVGPEFGTPVIVTEGEEPDAVPHSVLFTTEAAADAFREDAGAAELKVFPVNDLNAFLTQEELAGCVTSLNPGGHRASSGILWSDGERIVLDSFSGFWKLGPGGFELLE